MMRLIALLIVSLLQGVVVAGGMNSAQAQDKSHCDSQTLGNDTRDIKCSLNASGETRNFRFKANFSGGHDDTMASMTATLNGMPLACEKGSKTDLMGEDGDVSLECKFSIKEKADNTHVLGIALSWRHAQYTDFEFDSE